MAEAKNERKFICVWLDNQLTRSDDYLDTQEELRAMIKDFHTYSDCDACVDFLTDIDDGKIILITSNALGKCFIPSIYSIENLYLIYIFYWTKSSNIQWTNAYPKIQVFNQMKLICDRFLKDTTIKEDNPIAISFVSSTDIQSKDVNRQNPAFMYFQLIKDILLHDRLLESEAGAKTELLEYCRQTCTDDPTAIVLLDEFEADFIPELSIHWYTRESFLFKILNKALRTTQADVLYKLRYFLRHLHYQIISQAKLQHDRLSSMIVYRGQTMPMEDIDKLKRNLGGFLSFNNFLSTSLERKIALSFLMGSDMGVLFEMHIDPSMKKYPMVNIELISYMRREENEQEVLFTMGSVFRINRVDKQTNFYLVQLTLTDESDQQLTAYTTRLRQKTRTFHSFTSLLRLMDELGQYGSVDRFAEILRDDLLLSANSSLLSSIHHAFGSLYQSRGEAKKSLDHYQKSLTINLILLPADHSSLAPTYNNIGAIYLSQSNYNRALEYQQLALDCETKSKSPAPSSVIIYTKNVGKVYKYQGKYQEALEYFKRALELEEQFLSDDDLSSRETYEQISSIYFKLNDYKQAALYRQQYDALQKKNAQSNPDVAADSLIETGRHYLSQKRYAEALDNFQRALEIQQQYLVPNNPKFASTYNCMASAFYRQQKFEESLPYYKKALEIEQNSLSDDHGSIATSYHNISTAYEGLSRWSEALEYSLKSVEQVKKRFDADPSALAAFIHQVGHIYYQSNAYEQALIYFEEVLELYRVQMIENDATLAAYYHRTADTYYQLKRYNEALSRFQKTLDIEMRTLPENAHTIATTYASLSKTYSALNRLDDAVLTGEQAITQLLKTLPPSHPEVLNLKFQLYTIKGK